jgi:hypothetical protein
MDLKKQSSELLKRDDSITVVKKGKDVKDLTLTYSCCRKSQRTSVMC